MRMPVVVTRDTIAAMRREDLIESGPRSPQPGAACTYVTTPAFLARYGFDLPDFERLEDAGRLSKAALLQPDVLERLYTVEVGNVGVRQFDGADLPGRTAGLFVVSATA